MKERYKKGSRVTTIEYSAANNGYYCDVPYTSMYKSKNGLVKMLKSIGFKKVK